MNAEMLLTRRDMLKRAGALGVSLALGSPLSACGQENASSNTEPQSEIPLYISPESISSLQQSSSETYHSTLITKEFESHNFGYTADIPVDWVHQPGLSIKQAPIDLFLGQIPESHQTTFLVTSTTAEKGKTVEDYYNQILNEVSFDQQQQFEKTGVDGRSLMLAQGELFKNMEDPEDWVVHYPGGEKNGWVVNAFFPTEESYYYVSNTGIMKDNKVWQFNFTADGWDGSAMTEEIQKFLGVLDSLKLP